MARSSKMTYASRLAFDESWPQLAEFAQLARRPRSGWAQAIRNALGMSATDLAAKLKVAPSTVSRLEASEKLGTVNLESLAKMADALECDLVYAFVPKAPLEQIIERRAREVANSEIAKMQTTMALEDQGLSESTLNKLIEQRARELIGSRQLWK